MASRSPACDAGRTVLRTNSGYDDNQNICYPLAPLTGTGIVVMIHPETQYELLLPLPLVSTIASGNQRDSKIAQICRPTKYFAEASSINFRRSVRYGLGVLGVSFAYRACRLGWRRPAYLDHVHPDRFRLRNHPLHTRLSDTNVPLPPA